MIVNLWSRLYLIRSHFVLIYWLDCYRLSLVIYSHWHITYAWLFLFFFFLKRVFDSQRGIFCDCCKHWGHLRCTKFSYNEYNRLSNDSADWYCHLCIMDIFPFNKLEEFEFQLALAEFAIGHAKIGFKSLDKLHINPLTLNNKHRQSVWLE